MKSIGAWSGLRGALAVTRLVLALTACGGRGEPDLDRSASSAVRAEGPAFVRVSGDDEVLAINQSGIARTLTPGGSIDTANLFFANLGRNGRACVTCHVASQGWTVTPEAVRSRFEKTAGLDPLFRTNDGSNSPLADVTTVEARRTAFSMLLTKGLIRVGIGVPEGAEFELAGVDDPYGFANASELSLFRRPLPSANLDFLSGVMWDGRETLAGMTIGQDLAHQANGATEGHAQRVDALTEGQRAEIVSFERGLFFAQVLDFDAGLLQLAGGKGGPVNLSQTAFHLGINDSVGADPTGDPFDPAAMSLFAAWASASGNHLADARAAVARGENLFNLKPIDISGVRGLNDALGIPTLRGTCTSCHDTPNVGNHSVSLPLDLGLTDASRRTPDFPLYTLRNKATGEVFRTTDPGRALITGKWNDVARFKGPVLRGLAARAPYFHNGTAATLGDAVEFYDTRFGIGFTAQEKADLVAFLRSL
jgi:cytochrome c peroxidase